MKKFNVEIAKSYNNPFMNPVNDYVEAVDKQEAIEFVKDWMLENGMSFEEVESLIFQATEIA